jgi:hypothetical protein
VVRVEHLGGRGRGRRRSRGSATGSGTGCGFARLEILGDGFVRPIGVAVGRVVEHLGDSRERGGDGFEVEVGVGVELGTDGASSGLARK